MSFESHAGVCRYYRMVKATSATLTSPVDTYDKDNTWVYFTEGTGTLQCNIGYHDYLTLATDTYTSHDLYGAYTGTLVNNLNEKLRFDKVRWIYLKNHSATVNLYFFVSCTAFWKAMGTPSVTGKILPPKGEYFLMGAAGYNVWATNTRLRIKNNSVSTMLYYEMAIAGGGTIL